MSDTRIRICGMGGQGVIMTGLIIGKAATIVESRNATLIQSFGPEARGSTCSAQVTVADDTIGYPYITQSDIFLAFSQAAYDKFAKELRPGGTLIYESELVTVDPDVTASCAAFGIPGTRINLEVTKKNITFNMVMLGRFCACTDVVSKDAVLATIRETVPPNTIDMNTAAFLAGYDYRE